MQKGEHSVYETYAKICIFYSLYFEYITFGEDFKISEKQTIHLLITIKKKIFHS